MFATERLAYDQTAAFSKIVLHYLAGEESLRPFYAATPDMQGIKQAIAQKATQAVDRETLVAVLREQYAGVEDDLVVHNIEALRSSATFTVCTAHQPNLFSGPLYFIYKILHAIKLAEHLNAQFPAQHFVPVFYMGSEDADLDELNHFTVAGKKYTWQTSQTGAVGRMLVDTQLTSIIDELEQQLGVEPLGSSFCRLLRTCYQAGTTIQESTFRFVNSLFGEYGLLVLIADDARLKRKLLPVFEADLFQNTPSEIVAGTCSRLAAHYKVQATPRAINLFYLNGSIRERIERQGSDFVVVNSDLRFSEDSLKHELHNHPERFSPNVILRGLYQETILPNIAFIGGGGELAYWLQLHDLFKHFKTPFPVLLLRNSLLIIDQKAEQRIQKVGLSAASLFSSPLEILNGLLARKGTLVNLEKESADFAQLFDQLHSKAVATDRSLDQHIAALKAKTAAKLELVEKKLRRAERKKLAAEERQVEGIKNTLFPNGSLQERVENVGSFYARWGSQFISDLYDGMPALEAEFSILHETSRLPSQLE